MVPIPPIPSPFRQLRAVAAATLHETSRMPAVLLLALSGVLAVALVPVLQFHQFGEPGRLARDGGLAYTLLVGILLAASAAGSAISRECDGGTASVALSRPIPRGLFLLGKFLGVLALLAFFWVAMTASSLLAERAARMESVIVLFDDAPPDRWPGRLALLAPLAALAVAGLLDYARKARFGTVAFHGLWILLAASCAAVEAHAAAARTPGGLPALAWRLVPAALLIFGAIALFAALATLLATRLRPAPTLAGCAAALGLGLASDRLAALAADHHLRIPLWILPDIQAFWRADDLANGGSVPLPILASGMAYAAAWCALALLAAAALFRRRDLP